MFVGDIIFTGYINRTFHNCVTRSTRIFRTVGAKRTDFDKGAYNRPFEKVGPILSNDDRNKNKTNAGENQCRDSIARKRLIEKTKTENGSNGTDARIRGKEYYSTKNGVIYNILKVKGRPKKCSFPLTTTSDRLKTRGYIITLST